MKKSTQLILTTLLLILTINANAQIKYTTYYSSYVNKIYKIDLDTNKKAPFIDALSLDKLHDDGGIMLSNEQNELFVNSLLEARTKYIEWVKTAKENNVTELDKPMTIRAAAGAYFMYGSKWQFQHSVNLSFKFKIVQSKGETHYLLLIKTGELTSSSNQYMTMDGFIICFSSQKEIEDFIDALSPAKIDAFIKKPKPSDLFKD